MDIWRFFSGHTGRKQKDNQEEWHKNANKYREIGAQGMYMKMIKLTMKFINRQGYTYHANNIFNTKILKANGNKLANIDGKLT